MSTKLSSVAGREAENRSRRQKPGLLVPVRRDARGLVARRKALLIAERLERSWGVPRQPQRKPPPLDALVATVLSQHTTDRNSTRAFKELKRRFPRWELVAHSSAGAIAAAIRAGGLANQKAKRILRMVQELYGQVDRGSLRQLSNEEILTRLCALDGVGVKTAACVLLFSLGRDVFPVDVHVHRVLTRVGLVAGSSSPQETFYRMAPILSPGKAYSFHLNVVRLGRTFCRPTAPRCRACPVRSMCAFGSARPMRSTTVESRRTRAR